MMSFLAWGLTDNTPCGCLNTTEGFFFSILTFFTVIFLFARLDKNSIGLRSQWYEGLLNISSFFRYCVDFIFRLILTLVNQQYSKRSKQLRYQFLNNLFGFLFANICWDCEKCILRQQKLSVSIILSFILLSLYDLESLLV